MTACAGFLTLVLGVAVQPSGVDAEPNGRVLSHPAETAGPFASPSEVYGWIREVRPMTGGAIVNPMTDPEGAFPSFYILERDSTVWIQAPDGDMIVLDAYIPYVLGQTIGDELKFGEGRTKGIGYGFEEGEFILYLTSGMPQWVALGLLIVTPLAIGVTVQRLWRGLRLARERGAQIADSRRRLADSRENERARIARDLHDGPVQDLQAVRMRLGVLQRAADRGGSGTLETRATINAAQEDILRVVRELREVSEGLRPPVLGPFGLAAAVRALADRFRAAHSDIVLRLDLRGDGTRLSDPARLALYRIIQEALNNAATHADASAITVTYSEEGASASLAIDDDGMGFTVPPDLLDLEAAGHLGVTSMSERTASFGGDFRIESRPDEGTRVCVRVPSTAFTALPS